MARTAALPHVMSDRYISVVVKNKTFALDKSHPTFDAMYQALRGKQWAKAAKLVNTASLIRGKTGTAITVVGGKIYFKGREVHTTLSKRIAAGVLEGKDMRGYISFMNNLYRNPSKTAISELYDWLKGCNLPITDDGCFMAYKTVRDNYTDHHTGKINNKPGSVVIMPRTTVDDNRHNLCSSGLHFCSLGYLGVMTDSNSRLMKVKINPADVVSIPTDYQFTKGRTWRYEVVGEATREELDAMTGPSSTRKDLAEFQTSVFDYEKGRKGLLSQLLEHPTVKRLISKGKIKATTLRRYPLAKMKHFSDKIARQERGGDAVFTNPLKAARLEEGVGLSALAKVLKMKPAALVKLEKETSPKQSDVSSVLEALVSISKRPEGLSYKAAKAS